MSKHPVFTVAYMLLNETIFLHSCYAICVSILFTERYSYVTGSYDTGEGRGNDSGESAKTPLTEEEKLEQVKRSVNAP